jgi:predicted phage replisome organizer
MAKRYFWLKLKDNFFSDKRIKKLRKIAGGDTYTVIFLKMMLRTLQTDGVIEYEGIESTFAEELSLDLDEEPDNVQVTVNYLLASGLLVDLGENKYLLPTVRENTGGETAAAERMRNMRKRNNVTPMLRDGYVEKEIEKEKEKRKKVDYQQIADMYNDTCVSFPRLKTLSESRKQAIKARLKTYTIDDFKKMFEKAESSAFLKGGNDRNWSATFDWMIKDSNMAKILDGNYDSNKKVKKTRYDAADKEERLDDLTAIENMYLE